MLFERSGHVLERQEPSTMFDTTFLDGTTISNSTDSILDDSNSYNTDDSQYREKRIQHSADVEELIRALGGLNLERDYWIQTAMRVKSFDPIERYEGTKQFRMMLSVSGEIPIQDVIDTGVVPCLVEFTGVSEDAALQFEAAWALTNIASGTCIQTEAVVQAGAIPKLIELIGNPREDIREQGMWGLGNIAGDRTEFRDIILSYSGDSVLRFIKACETSRRASTIRTGIWSLSNLCRGKPRPKFSFVSSAIPYLATILSYSTDNDTLSDACWALDGISEHSGGITSMIKHGIVSLLIRMLYHRELSVQRPALRVIGQIAAGDAEQTQEILDHGALRALKTLLQSSRKGIRKDSCWTLSNIAAGSPHQLQELLNEGLIIKLVDIFHNDTELEVKKEAAWAICNACTSHMEHHLEYLISNNCLKPVCDMLTIDDGKILEVALEALENLLNLGDRLMQLRHQPSNVCIELLKTTDSISHLHHLYSNSQGFGNFKVWQKAGDLIQKWFSSGIWSKTPNW